MICSSRLVPFGSLNVTHELGSIKECVSIFHAVGCGEDAVVEDRPAAELRKEKKVLELRVSSVASEVPCSSAPPPKTPALRGSFGVPLRDVIPCSFTVAF